MSQWGTILFKIRSDDWIGLVIVSLKQTNVLKYTDNTHVYIVFFNFGKGNLTHISRQLETLGWCYNTNLRTYKFLTFLKVPCGTTTKFENLFFFIKMLVKIQHSKLIVLKNEGENEMKMKNERKWLKIHVFTFILNFYLYDQYLEEKRVGNG